MRRLFHKYGEHLGAISLVGERVAATEAEAVSAQLPVQ
jgi:hypothetical protein